MTSAPESSSIAFHDTAATSHASWFSFRRTMWMAVACVLASMLWLYRDGEDSPVRVNDSLDGSVSLYRLAAQPDYIFASSTRIVPQILGGVPRGCLPSETHLPLLPYCFLSPFHAVVFNELVMRLVGLIGMAMLLKEYLTPRAEAWAIAGAALCFAMLPCFPFAHLDIFGQPLLFYAFLNLGQRRRLMTSWAIIGLFPFLSHFALVGFFLVPLTGLYLLFVWVRSKRIPTALLVGTILLVAGYLAAEYRMVYQFVGPSGFASHRAEYKYYFRDNLHDALRHAKNLFMYGSFQHAHSLQYPWITVAVLLALSPVLLKDARDQRDTRLDQAQSAGVINGSTTQRCEIACSPTVAIFSCLATWAAACGVQALWRWQYTGSVILPRLGLGFLRACDIGRIHWLGPVLCGLVFGIALPQISKKIRWGNLIAAALIALQLIHTIQRHGTIHGTGSVPFRAFFSESLFADIKTFIGIPDSEYRVVSVGMYPAIAIYNGFYTADGYLSSYPLAYKQAFRPVIAGELAKSAFLRRVFDDWGCECYVFSEELGNILLYTKDNPKTVNHLSIDTTALKNLKVRYILSAVEIGNSDALNITHKKTFERPDSPWRVHLYSID